MTWPWRRKPRPTEGEEARKEATRNLAAADARWPEVLRVSRSLRDYRERNHIAEQLQNLFRGEDSP